MRCTTFFWKPCWIVNTIEQWKKPGCLGHIGDYTTQLYGNYCIINPDKDPYESTSIMENMRVFHRGKTCAWLWASGESMTRLFAKVKYLTTLEKFIEPLYTGTPSTIIDTWKELCRGKPMSSPFGSHGNALLAGHSVGIKPHSWKSVKPGLVRRVSILFVNCDFQLKLIFLHPLEQILPW